MLGKLLATCLLLTTVVADFVPANLPLPLMPKLPLTKSGPTLRRNGTELPPISTWYYFDQLIDHNNPGLGTFPQRYYYSYEFYKPGGPIMLITPGESPADGYYQHLGNASIFGLIAIQESAAMIMLEHRFYGESNPYPDLSVESLRVHTLQQAIDDFEYFATHVKLPMPGGDNVGPDKAPWIVAGGSYSGALAIWAMQSKPNLFWAGYASSAVVQTITDFWQYYEPIAEYMDRNCSADIQRVIAHVDKTLVSNNNTAISELKNTFGLGVLPNDDFASALAADVGVWQLLQPRPGPRVFHEFCEALEVLPNGEVAPPTGFGLEHALQAWGSYFIETHGTKCGDWTVEQCWGSDPDSAWFSDISVGNAGRSWLWIVCNEVGWIQAGPPAASPFPAIASRLLRPDDENSYYHRVCRAAFPGAFSIGNPPLSRVDQTNGLYDGWSVQVERVFVANGIRDPWKEATLSAQRADVVDTPGMPIAISDAFHCSDIASVNGIYDNSVYKLQQEALGKMREWIRSWGA